MPTNKTREEFIEEMRYSLGLKNPASFEKADMEFFEKMEEKYSDVPIADLEKELNDLTKEIPQKKEELKELENQLTDEITKKIENDLATHQKKLEEALPEDYEERKKGDKKEQRLELLDERDELSRDIQMAENNMVIYGANMTSDVHIPGEKNLVDRCARALEKCDSDEPVFDDDFWKNKFGYVFDEKNDELGVQKSMVVSYLESVVKYNKLLKDDSIIIERINALEKNQTEYYGKSRDEWKKEEKIVNYLKGASVKTSNAVGVPTTVEGVTFDYTCAGNNKEYAQKQKELDEKNTKKAELTQYIRLRKSLGKRVSDIDSEKLKTSFQKYRDADEKYNKLNRFEKFFARIFSGRFYGPAAIKRERDAYRHALTEIGMKDEEIDAKKQEFDGAQATKNEEAKPETTSVEPSEAVTDNSAPDFYQQLEEKTASEEKNVENNVQDRQENLKEKATNKDIEIGANAEK